MFAGMCDWCNEFDLKRKKYIDDIVGDTSLLCQGCFKIQVEMGTAIEERVKGRHRKVRDLIWRSGITFVIVLLTMWFLSTLSLS